MFYGINNFLNKIIERKYVAVNPSILTRKVMFAGIKLSFFIVYSGYASVMLIKYMLLCVGVMNFYPNVNV